MLFNSFEFLFAFLPVTLAVGLWLQQRSREAFIGWMIAASLVFYGSWHPQALWILLASLLVNYAVALAMAASQNPVRRGLLVAGLVWNLGLLGYFKYTNFLGQTIRDATGFDPGWAAVVLPVGISFFTFQKIAFLVDVWRGPGGSPGFARFSLFVMFFPQLIAGPIVHHRELIPQFDRPNARLLENLALGATIFTIGLVKKLYVADAASIPASALFDGVAAGGVPTFADAWLGALAYTVQIYFDFSAYSDMAIGLARMFGLDLPINFASPYKARSIVDFWRRWHISLSRFLRDYLYIPLGGSRKGPRRQHLNLMATMVLGGFWHGAGFTFILWGAMHGAFLLVQHAFSRTAWSRWLAGRKNWPKLAWLITFLLVVLAWVPFRAADLATTFSIWGAMAKPQSGLGLSIVRDDNAGLVAAALAVAILAPNLYQIFGLWRVGLPSPGYPATYVAESASARRRLPRFGALEGVGLGVLLAAAVIKLNDVSAFIYFQF